MRIEHMIPEVYYKESRDFAYVGRLLEILLNYIKTGADCVAANNDNQYANSNLLKLLIDTLGFNTKHAYINKDLAIVASAFSEILRNKGSLYAVDLAVRLMLNSQGFEEQEIYQNAIYDSAYHLLIISLPHSFKDVILLEDLLDYILPVGVIYEIRRMGSADTACTTAIAIDTDNSEKAVSYYYRENANHEFGMLLDTLDRNGNEVIKNMYANIDKDLSIVPNILGSIGTGMVVTEFEESQEGNTDGTSE